MVSLGDTLAGRYRLEALIGVGGFATVFRAQDLRLERDVALKILLPNHAADPIVVARFDREARALAAFSHPNVVAIHDVEPAEPSLDQEPFLVMDLCEGGSLADRLAATGSAALSPDVLVPILVDVAAGLDALHDAGMVHRDVKPSNVLLSGGRALIADLGIVAFESGDVTASSEAVGTLAFLAPEQLAGSPATPACDVHSVGVVAYLGLTGRLPRPAGSIAELVAASRQDPAPVSALVAELGTVFDRPIASALSPDPAARPSVSQLGLRLQRGLERWAETAAILRTSVSAGPPSGTGLVAAASGHPGLGSSDAGPSPEDPTVIVSVPTTKPLARAAASRSTIDDPADVPTLAVRQAGGDRMALIVGAVVIALLIALAALVAVVADLERRGGGLGALVATPAASPARASPTAAVSATPAVTPAPAATPQPTTAGPWASAVVASREMQVAIDAARGRAGLNGREVKAIDAPLAQFDRALAQQDAEQAREAAAELEEAVRELVEGREVDRDAGARLLDAAEGLLEAAADLPDR